MRTGARRFGALLAGGIMALGACGGGHHGPTSRTTTPVSIPKAVSRDVWNPPDLSGPQNTGTFCTALIADYRHAQQNQIATTTKVKVAILGDFAAYTPKVADAAPAAISGPAHTYLGAITQVISALVGVDLDASKLAPGSLAQITDDPQVKAAEVTFDAWSEQNCRFDITSDGP